MAKWSDNCVWQVWGEDEKCYGTFLDYGRAVHFHKKLEEEFGLSFRLETYSIGPSAFFRHLMNDFEEKK